MQALIKGLVGRLASDQPPPTRWHIDHVERLLEDLGITGATFDYEAKVVILEDLDDLFSMMSFAGKKALSDRCRLSMSTWKKKVCLNVGGWQFETEDTRS